MQPFNIICLLVFLCSRYITKSTLFSWNHSPPPPLHLPTHKQNMGGAGGGVKRSTGVANKFHDPDKDALSLVPTTDEVPLAVIDAPIITSYNERIRPLLDAVDRLRLLNVMKEGIQLPTIVVVGDQSSGKSSVLESLAGISLPRGQGICTRVPLIMRLQNQQAPEAQLFLEFNGKTVTTNEERIAVDINLATEEIAGNGKGISNVPLTLVVRKNGVPDLTMVDLPGITRVPVHGQPENIYDQIRDMIMEYIKPEESIILNVLSASVDFTTCESIRMSQQVDKTGERTLAVVTKADKAPEGLLEKVLADDVNIGLGYVCVRNRIGDESYEDARREEADLFRNHPLLSKIDKTIVGIPVLAHKLVQIQATGIARCLPGIVRNIDQKLNANANELEKMPRNLSSVAEAITAFMRVIGSAKESLRKILLRAEFDEFPDDKQMHCSPRLVEMLNSYSDQLHKTIETGLTENFLMEEIKVLEEYRQIGLSNFLPRASFLFFLQRNIDKISNIPMDFVAKVWDYLEHVILTVLEKHCENYSQLQLCASRGGHNLMVKMKARSSQWVKEMVEMEKLTDYTSFPDYMSEWNKLMSFQGAFVHDVCTNMERTDSVVLEDLGTVRVAHLRNHSSLVSQAFDLKMRMLAYWKIVLRRLVDSVALNLQYNLHKLVDREMEAEIVEELMTPRGGGIERMLEESPVIAGKREKLKRSIKLLKDSKDVVAKVMDRIASSSD